MASSILVAIVSALIIMGFAEYAIHRWFMHRPSSSAYFEEHAISHHAKNMFYVGLDLPVTESLKVSAPLAILVVWFWWQLSLAILVVSIIHALLWTSLHRSFHNLGRNWISYMPFWTFLRDHHDGHHKNPRRNFGAVYGPVFDYIFMTRYHVDQRRNDINS